MMGRGVLVLIVCLVVVGCAPALAQQSPEASEPPNVVFFLTDDMRQDELARLPGLQEMLSEQGTTFANSFVTDPVCCPSRTTLLTGEYAHNHNVRSIRWPTGGYARFQAEGLARKTVAVRLQAAGYSTGLFGKYLNGYRGKAVPPGWDEWDAWAGQSSLEMSHNGRVVDHGDILRTRADGKHHTDVVTKEAVEFVEGADGPFFALVADLAPHSPHVAAYRHQHAFDRLDPPEEGRMESLLSVEDQVREVMAAIEAKGQLDSTYFVFASDNGYLLGEHGKTGKEWPYEESIRVPLVVKGPGVAAQTRDEAAINTDWAPTVLELAGAEPLPEADGRSLVPLLRGESPEWRDAFLIEQTRYRKDNGELSPVPSYDAVRTQDALYVEYRNGEVEQRDLAGRRTIADGRLSERLRALRSCAGDSCRAAEDSASDLPPTEEATAP